ncbi:MAG: beta-ketoacyl-[acyl-carrier-protein] synthase family protein [Prevotellaceae bacterium]|jgi:3-oxoacyl-[acyl-carrier-protein] synthase-1|nr:beta-ketoacyl-[acyl-carrier-protein] synthase family protein [Prevotellaceae bacterium]
MNDCQLPTEDCLLITGVGIISALGRSVKETLDALRKQQSGLSPVTILDTKLKHIPAGEVKYSDEELLDQLGISTGRDAYTRTALLGLAAAEEAMRMSQSGGDKKRISLVSSTTTGGMRFHEKNAREIFSGTIDRKYISLLDCADAAQQIAQRFGITENITTVSTACSSSANAIIVGARMIKNGLADKVLVGGTDALTRFALNGFNSLEILSPDGCRPFDARRNGVSLGEGAAYLVLESAATARPERILCRLSGYANTNEAYHQTASSPGGEGAAHSIRQALASAGLRPEDIDYINAHGTGTQINDLSEGRAIETVFGHHIPPVSSTKGYTGHTLAAAGAAEAVISILALQHSMLFPNLRFTAPMPELSFTPQTTLEENAPLRHVLSNSFGFGGSNASLIFSRP